MDGDPTRPRLRRHQFLDLLAGSPLDEKGHEAAYLPVREVAVRGAHDLFDGLPGDVRVTRLQAIDDPGDVEFTMTWVAGLVPPPNHASALSLRLTGNRLGQVFIPLTAGADAVFVLTGGAAISTWRALERG